MRLLSHSRHVAWSPTRERGPPRHHRERRAPRLSRAYRQGERDLVLEGSAFQPRPEMRPDFASRRTIVQLACSLVVRPWRTPLPSQRRHVGAGVLGRTHENGARYLTIERDAPRAFLSRAPLVGERDLVLEGSAAIPGETPCLLTQREKPCASTCLSLVGRPACYALV